MNRAHTRVEWAIQYVNRYDTTRTHIVAYREDETEARRNCPETGANLLCRTVTVSEWAKA